MSRKPVRLSRKAVKRGLEWVLGTGIRSTDVFVVGYPRSGNTWMQFLLTHALLEKRDGDWVTLKTLRDYIPNLNHIGPGDAMFLGKYMLRAKPRMFFTHSPFDIRIAQAKIIYVLRDPRDVLVSYFHFHRRKYRDFALETGDFLSLEAYSPCRWDEHVAGWLLDHQVSRMNIVRYEDLRSDPAKVLSEVLMFVGLPYSEVDLQRAVDESSFERTRELDRKYTLQSVQGDSSEYHARRGKVGGWVDELDSTALDIITSQYGTVACQVGYALNETP